MTSETASTTRRIPSIVNALNPLVRRLLRLGMPMGPNALLTVRGRTSGEPRTFPVTLMEADGRRFVFSAFGEVNWVHNLRAAGEATLKRGRRTETVAAMELTPEAAAPLLEATFATVLKVKGFGSMIGGWYGVTADSTAADYLASAHAHPGFELRGAPITPVR
jgi:deazaflavin-dependent oxidoreductase (nitroreductase family)